MCSEINNVDSSEYGKELTRAAMVKFYCII